MSASSVKARDVARASVDAVLLRLNRIATHIIISNQVDGGLDALDAAAQHAVRIVRSRMRFLERLYTSIHGLPSEMEQAKRELAIGRDNGDIFVVGDRNHRVGTLDCGACEWVGASDVVKLPLSRFCPHCSKGVQHAGHVRVHGMAMEVCGPPSYGVETVIDVASGTVRKQVYPLAQGQTMKQTTGTPAVISLGSPQVPQNELHTWRSMWVCDNPACGKQESREQGVKVQYGDI